MKFFSIYMLQFSNWRALKKDREMNHLQQSSDPYDILGIAHVHTLQIVDHICWKYFIKIRQEEEEDIRTFEFDISNVQNGSEHFEYVPNFVLLEHEHLEGRTDLRQVGCIVSALGTQGFALEINKILFRFLLEV